MRLRHLGQGIELGFLVQNRRKRKKKKKMSGKKAVKEKNTKEKNTKVKAAKETLDRQLEEKRSLAGEIIRRLELEYPDAGCTLDYNQAWKLLVSVRLAAQCTDARVNVVVQELYKKFPDVQALAQADVDEIEEIVRPCGLGRSKARDISACMKMLRDEYDGNVANHKQRVSAARGAGIGTCRAAGSAAGEAEAEDRNDSDQ